MTRSLRRLSLGLVLLMVLLMVQLTRLQVFQASDLNARPGNQRTLLTEYAQQRGPIMVDKAPIAQSELTPGDALKYLRTYAAGPMFASATGFYSIVFGSTGLERAENDVLSGDDPRLWVDRMQQLFAGRDVRGGTVTTTLDAAAQAAAWRGLEGKLGSVVAIEPSTGRILAQVQSPSFDPGRLSSHDSKAINEYYSQLEADPDKPLLNRPIAKTNPPGSTFKVVTAAAALEAGYSADDVIPGPETYRLPGTDVDLPNWTGTECGPDGEVTLAEALAISCNTAFAWLGIELGDDALRAQAERFGFEESFEIPLRAATSRFPEEPDAAQTGMSAIGQFDVRATTLQMAMVVAAVGNQGVTMRPWLVDGTTGPDLSTLDEFRPRELGRAMSVSSAAELTRMMVGVVNSGTGSSGRIPGVQVAGKTGTAQTSEDRPAIAWYVSFAPAQNPQVAVAVAVEDAGTNEVSGNQIAGPIARSVMQAVLGG